MVKDHFPCDSFTIPIGAGWFPIPPSELWSRSAPLPFLYPRVLILLGFAVLFGYSIVGKVGMMSGAWRRFR